MADAYSAVKKGSLKLKGVGSSSQPKKRKKPKLDEGGEEGSSKQRDMRYGLWWLVETFTDLVGNVVLEGPNGCFVTAVDDGSVTLSPPRSEEADPPPVGEEIFTVVKISDNRIALKTGFGRYLTLDGDNGSVSAHTEAMGVREMWEPVLQDPPQGDSARFALRGHNKHLIVAEEGRAVHAMAASTVEATFFKVRNCGELKEKAEHNKVEEDLGVSEVNTVKKFQSFQDGKLKVSVNDKTELSRAKKDGNLNEVLLDRREKMKADRYCK